MILKEVFGFESNKSILKEIKDALKGDDAEDVSDGGAKGFSKAWSDAAESFKDSMSSMNDSGANVFKNLTTSTGTFFKTFWSGLSTLGKVSVVFAGITTAATIAYKVFDHFYDTVEETKEKAEGFVESISNITSNMPTDSSTLSSLNSEYQELSKGVNELGQNVSLSSDEYERYKEIIAQVSEIMPDMAGQFNSQGEQIGFAQGKLADLNTEYEKYIQNQAKEFLVNGDEDGNTFQDVLNNYGNNSSRGWFDEAIDYFKNLFGFGDIDDVATDIMISTFKDLQGKSKAQIALYLDNISETVSDEGRAKSIVKSILGSSEEILEMTDSELQQLIASNIESLQNSKDADMNKIIDVLIGSAYSKDSFWDLETEMRDDVTTMLSSLNSDIWDSFDWDTNSDTEVSRFVESIISSISSNENGIRDAWDNLFKLNINELSADEYISKVNEYIDTIGDTLGLDEDSKNQFLISLGFDIDTEDNINKMRSDIEKVLSDGTENLNTLTLSDLQIAAKITADFDEDSINWDDLMTEIDIFKYLGENAVTSFQDVLDSLDLSSTNLFGDSTEFTDIVDDYIEKVNKLKIALKKLDDGTLTNSDINKLINDFPQLKGETDNLDNAIVNLLGDLNTGMIGEFADQFDQVDTSEARNDLSKTEHTVLSLGSTVGNTQFSIDFNTETTSIQNLATAMKESVAATGLTSESIDNLKERYSVLVDKQDDLDKLFEETTNGIHLNRQALNELENEYENQNMDKINNELKNLRTEYENLTGQIETCQDAQQLAGLYSERDSILQRINDTAELAAQYEGLTSKYNQWQIEQEAGNERDMYEGIISGRKEMEEEMERGWFDDDTVAYLELLSGKELSTAPIDDQIAAYQKLNDTIGNTKYTVFDFFTTDDDGNSTSEGVFNFFDTVKDVVGETAAWVDENGKYHFDFSEIEGGDEAIAEALGISEELVQIILRAADDAGFEVNLESAYTDLADFKEEVGTVNDALKDCGATDYTFNINATDLDYVNEQIGEARTALQYFSDEDGKINLDSEDAKGAASILATLIYRKSELENPTLMSIDVSEPESKVEEVIKLAQELKDAYADLQIQTEIGADTTEAQQKVDSLLEKLNSEGYADITADLKIDTTNTNIESTIASINAITPDLMITAGLDTSKIDGYEPPDETVNVKYEKDSKEVDEYDPDDLERTVTFNKESKEVDDYDPKDLTRWVTFKKDSYEVDNYTRNLGNITKTVTYKIQTEGTAPKAAGTAHSIGTIGSTWSNYHPSIGAYAGGTDWTLPQNEEALVNEIGMKKCRYKIYLIAGTPLEFYKLQRRYEIKSSVNV